MSRHWRPEGKIVRLRPVGEWTKVRAHRQPRGPIVVWMLCGAALVGIGIGALLGRSEAPEVASPVATTERVQPKVETIVPQARTDPADAEWQRRGKSSAIEESEVQPGLPRADGARNDVPVRQSSSEAIYVIDGDTFMLGRRKVRIANIDAPEIHPPRCPEEARLGLAATERLRALIGSGPVTLSAIGADHDEHGRLLRNVSVNGQDIGEAMIGSGLARAYAGGRRPWC